MGANTNVEAEAADFDFEEGERLSEIAYGIETYYVWVLCAVGLPANILTILTILTMQAMTPATFLVAVLAYCDGSALLAKLTIRSLVLNVRIHENILCVMEFLPPFFQTVANWILVFICVERFISVCFPLKKTYLLTKRRCYICTVVIIAGFFLFFASIFGIMRASFKGECAVKLKFAWFWTTIWFWITNSLMIFLPFVCLFGLTVAIIRGLRNSSRDRRSILRQGSGTVTNSSGHQRSSAINERQIMEAERVERTITTMMILAAVFFLVFSLPSCVFHLTPEEDYGIANMKRNLFEQIQFLLLDSTHALNFFLYFFTAKRFRTQLMKIVCCSKCRKLYRKRHQNKLGKKKSKSLSITQLTHVGI